MVKEDPTYIFQVTELGFIGNLLQFLRFLSVLSEDTFECSISAFDKPMYN